ncbi:MAG: response regulator [Sphingomonadales bacterium]
MGSDFSSPGTIDFAGKRILVADDMKLNQYLIKQLLTERGAQLVIVSDGLEALERCKEQLFDLVILDIRMPRLDGVSACRAIRKLDSTNAMVPIVALTAHMFEEEQQAFFSGGMNAAVVKPIEPEMFLPLLKRLLSNGSSQATTIVTADGDTPLRIDLTYLKNIGNNDPSFIAMMLSSFLQNANQLQQRLSVAVDATDIKSIGEIAHQLKFSLGVLGVKAVEEKLGWLQQQALIAGVQDVDRFIVRSRRLQEKLAMLVEQAVQLQRGLGQASTGNT